MNSRYLLPAIFASVISCHTVSAGTVTTIADSGVGSLRAAIAGAINGETIDFDSSLSGLTIILTGGELAIMGLQLNVDASSLQEGITISGNNNSRIFNVSANSNVVFKKLKLIHGRSAAGSGGALQVSGGQLEMTNCMIASSYAATDGGGAYFGNGVSLTIDRCAFLGNQGINFGGGFFLIGVSSATMTNSVISGNVSTNGGGMFNFASTPFIINCTVQGNRGGGVQSEGAVAGSIQVPAITTLRNSIVWNNRITGSLSTIAAQQLKNGPFSNPNVDYCLIENASNAASFNDSNSVTWGSNNIAGTPANDPQFVSPTAASAAPNSDADLRLFVNAPGINVGNNSFNSTQFDLAGRTRIQEITIDLGAFESGYVTFSHLFPTLSLTGDENNNGQSNFLEYAAGFDPTLNNNASVNPIFSTSGGFNFLTSSQRTNALDVNVLWETSTTLQSLSWQTLILGTNYLVEAVTFPSPIRQETVFKLLDGGDRRFYRQVFTNDN